MFNFSPRFAAPTGVRGRDANARIFDFVNFAPRCGPYTSTRGMRNARKEEAAKAPSLEKGLRLTLLKLIIRLG